MTRPIGAGWKGFLTIENMDEVASVMLAMLKGKNFAVASVRGFEATFPGLSNNCTLAREGIRVFKGSVSEWKCKIGFYWKSGVSSVDDGFYVQTTDLREVSKLNSCWVEIGYGWLKISVPRLRDTEYIVISI